MNKLKLKILVLAIIFPLISNAQGWEKSYSGKFSPISQASDKTLDGGIIMAVSLFDDATNTQSLFLYKTDTNGNIIWEYHDSTHVDSLIFIHSVHSTSDGNYLVSFSYSPNPWYPLTFPTPSVVQKISANGTVLWETTSYNQLVYNIDYICENSNGEYILVGDSPYLKAGVIKLDSNGNQIWETSFQDSSIYINSTGSRYPKDVIVSSTDDILIISQQKIVINGAIEAPPTLIKLNNNGNLQWEKEYTNVSNYLSFKSLKELSSGDIIIAGKYAETPTSFNSKPFLLKVDSDGTQLWHKLYPQGDKKYITSVLETNDGDLVLGGTIQFPINLQSEDFYLLKVDSFGNLLWEKTFGRSKREVSNEIFLTDEQGFYLTGFTQNFENFYHPYIIKTDSLGILFSNSLEGILFNDENFDCAFDGNEIGMSQWLIQATKGESHYSSITSEFGEYNFTLDTGTYQIEVSPFSPYWVLCDTTFEVTFATPLDTIIQNIPAQPEINCPLLDVSIGTPFLRKCFPNTYVVNYCNVGTAVAEDAYVEVTFDPFMIVNSSSIPISNQDGDIYTFDLGDVEYDTCGSFTVEILLGDSTNCDSIMLGATHCVEAHIYPDSICLSSGTWSGASIEVDANCIGDSIIFYIQNVGTAPTQPNLQYIVVEDDVILFDGTFSLNPMESEIITIATNGSTFRLEAEQEPNHPGMSMPSVSIENCGLPNTTFSFGYVNIFAQDDGDLFVDIDCRENNGSFDPNDKQGFPLGYNEENYINRGQDIEYLIRFQNTGTDTAFTVIVKDLLSEYLDISTVRPGASSHPYEYSVSGEGLMSFSFNNIMLPDSFVNEVASNGFVKFKVSQKPNLDLETQIHNQAAIYFDFNAPIFTNKTLHTIGENFVIVSIDGPSEKSLAKVKVHPNPFSQFVKVEIEGIEIKNGNFKLFDSMGRLLREQNFSNNKTFTFHKKDLQAGMYFFTIEENGQLISNGKLIAQ